MPTDPGPEETPESTGSIKDLILEQEEAASLIKNRSLLEPNEIVDEALARDARIDKVYDSLPEGPKEGIEQRDGDS